MGKANAYSPEFRDEAVKHVIESQRSINRVANELGISSETLRNWVRKYRKETPDDAPSLDTTERARLRELERLNREKDMEIAFLKKAAAYFAKDRP
ncbi:transposase-like protein [Haloactinospora alba]|uniref:Transposase-like protein n=1 Tax=Haloactinospora alba TaxID=405555 RepID=A0A543NG36_9ACTN|nr:transposase [Haloactinospora alba]TQN28527.1 transposase-like protein [Haloactinospora alba]TQN30751.1 transposase-like protein [Haloactinospora alba]TQN31914.1 transposase-like protein [Haloactinospora alba]TQN32180.1 transposase-like protein [Haloactinospora alba]TQN32184.1 transposase-like protein [Haloactinospora alba]